MSERPSPSSSTAPELTPAERERLAPYVVDETPEKNSNLKWVLISLATLLWHLGMLETPVFRGGWRTDVQAPIPIDMQEIDPAKLEAIRQQWKTRGQALLLSKDTTPPDPNAPKPKNARYLSDRNRTVEKEQRAAETNVIPATRGTQAERDRQGRTGQKAQPTTPAQEAKKLSDLSNLGVPIASNAPRPKPREVQEAQEAQKRGGADQGDQAIRDPELPVGAENLLNTQESVYYSFYARLYEAIGPLWQSKIRSLAGTYRVGPGEYTTRVQVILDRDGNFVETRVLRTSGVQVFDAAVDDSWRKIPRFPNPPRDLLDSNGLLSMGWNFTVLVDRSTGFQYVPPERDPTYR